MWLTIMLCSHAAANTNARSEFSTSRTYFVFLITTLLSLRVFFEKESHRNCTLIRWYAFVRHVNTIFYRVFYRWSNIFWHFSSVIAITMGRQEAQCYSATLCSSAPPPIARVHWLQPFWHFLTGIISKLMEWHVFSSSELILFLCLRSDVRHTATFMLR